MGISKDKVCNNTARPVGRFKDGRDSDAVGRDRCSENGDDSEQEMILSEMNLSKMNSSETSLSNMNSSDTNLSLKLLNLTSVEQKNLCWEIGTKKNSKRLDRMRGSGKRN